MADFKEIKKGLYSKLTTGTALMALATGVYDRLAPGTATYPYVVYELGTGDDVRVVGGRAATIHRLTVKAVDESESSLTAHDIMDEVDALLERQTLTLTGWGSVYLRREQRFGEYVEIGDDGNVYQHVPAIYTWTVKESS